MLFYLLGNGMSAGGGSEGVVLNEHEDGHEVSLHHHHLIFTISTITPPTLPLPPFRFDRLFSDPSRTIFFSVPVKTDKSDCRHGLDPSELEAEWPLASQSGGAMETAPSKRDPTCPPLRRLHSSAKDFLQHICV